MIGDRHRVDIGDLGLHSHSQAQSDRERVARQDTARRARGYVDRRFKKPDCPFPPEAKDELIAMLGLDRPVDGMVLTQTYPALDEWG